MVQHLPLACFLSLIRPPGITFEDSFLQILPVDKAKCPFVRDHSDVTVRLYTRHNPVMYQELRIGDDEALFASNMNFNDPTVFYFSAWMEQPDDGSGMPVREAYMLRGDTNFIIFDLSRLEAGPWYFTAAENTWYIGNFAAKLIDYLVSRGLDLKKTHLVGHSLGAQSAGVAGAVIKSGRVSRITGLDPAFPLFDKLPLTQRLDPSDADFVDVIHTDAGIFGFPRPMGHVDFYPNGGISPQPGCELEVVLHEQRLLNNCDGRSQIHGFYTFHLDTKKNSLRENIIQFFLHIQNLKKSNNTLDISQEIEVNFNEDPSKEQVTNKDFDNLDSDTVDVKQNNLKPKTNLKKKHNPKHKTKTDVEDTLELLDETEGKTNYKREKRISVLENNNTTEGDKQKDTRLEEERTVEETKTYEPDFDNKETVNNKNETKYNFKNMFYTKIDIKETPKNVETGIKEKTTIIDTKTSKRQKRFISFFKNNNENDENFLLKMLEFLIRNRKNVIPVVTVMREINTLVKSANGELTHSSKEKNNYIGTPPQFTPITYDLEVGDSKGIAFVKRLLGLGVRGGKLKISGSK